jgi:cytochrome c553
LSLYRVSLYQPSRKRLAPSTPVAMGCRRPTRLIGRLAGRQAGPLAGRLIAALLIAAALFPIAAAASEGDDDLLMLMSTLQTLTHKLQLSLDAANLPLAAFYAHELEELGETVAGIASYDGHPIGALTTGMLLPQIEAVNASVRVAQGEDVDSARAAFERMLGQCNACHAATGHGVIVIERNPANPYAQSFAPR